METKEPSRRWFLFALVLTFFGLPSSEFGKHGGRAHSSLSNPVKLARKLFSNGRSIRQVRERYVRLYPAEAEPVVLMAALSKSNPAIAAVLLSSDHHRLASLARAQVRRDFEENDVVSLEGWLLSRTEVRLATLAAAT